MIERLSREAFATEAIKKQIDLAKSDSEISQAMHNEWKAWFIHELRERFKMTKRGAEDEFRAFNYRHGLPITY